MLEYREFRTLEESPLQCVWELRGHGREQQRITPDGRFEIIVHLLEPFEAHSPTGWKKQSGTLVSGQLTQPLLVRPTGATHTIGVRLKSWASRAITGLPANELTNQVVDSHHISRNLRHMLLQAVDGSKGDLAKIAGRIVSELGREGCADQRIASAVEAIDRTQGQCRVDVLARIAGLSFKQLERLFDEHVGVGPKTLIRIRRFSHVFAHLQDSHVNWAEVAYECGYSDQSHLTRDFAQFAGVPPAALLSSQSDLARCFTAAPAG